MLSSSSKCGYCVAISGMASNERGQVNSYATLAVHRKKELLRGSELVPLRSPFTCFEI